MRRDVSRNRARLLEAARTVVAKQGPEAPLDDIARAAGVSRTTLHRHFPDRESLAAAALASNVAFIEARAYELAGRADGAEQLFHEVLDLQIESPWLAHMVVAGRGEELGNLRARTLTAFEGLMGPAEASHRLQEGVSSQDALLALPMMMAVLAVQTEDSTSDITRARRMLHRGLFLSSPPGQTGAEELGRA